MGYSEVGCRLCGVKFNIGRIRKLDEPFSHGWMNTGDVAYTFVDAEEARWMGAGNCTSEDGCQNVWRDTKRTVMRREERWHPIAVDIDTDADLDYVYESSDGEEPLEYDSDEDLVDNVGLADEAEEEDQEEQEDEDVEMTDVDSDPQWARFLKSDYGITPEDPDWARPLKSNFGITLEPGKQQQERPLDDVLAPEVKINPKEALDWEHVAGPTCSNRRGYNGYRISAEEMRGCNTFQCLVRKSGRWSLEEHDQEFEAKSTHFLSGIHDHMPSTDSGGWPRVLPARHGVEEVFASEDPWSFDGQCMPFHTTCFDMFMRLSKLRLGFFDVEGLCSWYDSNTNPHIAYTFFIDDNDIRACQDQSFNHAAGTEYLAANPLFVPRLGTILQSAVSNDPTFNAQRGAFNALAESSPGNLNDSFGALPLELRLEVLRYLDPKDIANVRLSSRTFYQLPIYLWREFIQRDMPWLWETWSDQKPYIWTTVPAEALRKEKADIEAAEPEYALYRDVIKHEMPELLDLWLGAEADILAARQDLIARCETETLKDAVWTVPAEKIDWYQLYSDITRNWKSLKGLQNRRRIWKAQGRIIDWIRDRREEGKILN